MSEKDKINKIERYLSGELPAEEMADFENQLTSDKDLAQEIDFQRNIESILASRPEDDFRKNLNELDLKYSKTSSGFNRYLFLGIGVVFMVAILGWWMNQSEIQPDTVNSNEPTEIAPPTQPAPPPIQEFEPIKGEEEIPEEETTTPEPSPQKNPTPPKETPKTENKPQPIAANFEPNELLESRLGSLRSDGFNVEEVKPDFQIEDGKIDFILKGNFKTDQKIEEVELTLYIFSNKKEDYENFNPAFSTVLTFEELENQLEFNISESIELAEGLYYYQIEDEDGEIFYMNKFTVK